MLWDEHEEQQQPPEKKKQQSYGRDIVGEIATSIVTKGAPNEPVLSRFAEYPNMVFPEFRKFARMLFHPANLMGYRSHSEIADILNELEYLGLEYKCKPAGLHTDKYAKFQLFIANASGLLNLSTNGKLIQAETRFLFPETLAKLKKANVEGDVE